MPDARERVACCYRTLDSVLRDLPAAWEKIRDRVTKSSWTPDKKKQRGAVSRKKLQKIRKQAVLANLLVAELEMHASSESDVSEAARSLLDRLHERTEVADLFGDLVAKGAIPASPLALAKDAGA